MADTTIGTSTAARAIGVAERTIIRWADLGKLPNVGLGRARRFRPEDVERLRVELEQKASA